jgi:hypothetical protein
MYIRKLNKKAQDTEGPPAERTVFLIFLFIIIPLTIFAFVSIVRTAVYYKENVPKEVEEYVLVQKFLSSEDCFAYYDSLSGQFIPLSFDISILKDDTTLDGCIPPTGDYPRIRLTLESDELKKTLSNSNWNQELGPDRIFSPKTVTLYKDGKTIGTARIAIEVQDV